MSTEFAGLPGGEMVAQGLDDLGAGRETAAALVVGIARPRLVRQGIGVPETPWEGDLELRLYALLFDEDEEGAYSRYNALLREITSFASALEREEGRRIRAAGDKAASRRGSHS